jgi:catechol 2,3-dioxygenase-like lactoylglutathione lyase family enzyme
MYDHIGLHVKDLGASVRFYEATLAPLGCVVTHRDARYAGLGPEKDVTMLWLHPTGAKVSEGTHVALQAKDRAAVDRFHRAGLEWGGRDNGAPGVRHDYGANYYAAFLLDPDGHNIEAVCLSSP